MDDVQSVIQCFDTSGCALLYIDPRRGDLSEWRAWSKGRTQSLTQEMGLASGRQLINEPIFLQREGLTWIEIYDHRQEKLGWYRTARVAAILHIDRRWLDFAVECGTIKGTVAYGMGTDPKRIRVRLEEARAWRDKGRT